MTTFMIILVTLIIGMGVGYLGNMYLSKTARKMHKLQNLLLTAKQEHKLLQENLDDYFKETNNLVFKLVDDYQILISKLSEGSRKFSTLTDMNFPAVSNDINNPGVEGNLPYTLDTFNKKSYKDKDIIPPSDYPNDLK